MGNRVFKDKLYEQYARIGKALSNQHRLELLEILAQGPRTVEALARESGLMVGNTSAHLQVLKESRLVEATKEGLFVEYRLAGDDVGKLMLSVRTVAESRLAEVDRIVTEYLGHRDDMDAVGFSELRDRMRSGDVIVLDVRPLLEFNAGHISGAISIPHDEVERRLKAIPKDKEIVAYCRGPYCVYADEAVTVLRKRGRKARRLVGGFPEWKAARLPVETATTTERG